MANKSMVSEQQAEDLLLNKPLPCDLNVTIKGEGTNRRFMLDCSPLILATIISACTREGSPSEEASIALALGLTRCKTIETVNKFMDEIKKASLNGGAGNNNILAQDIARKLTIAIRASEQ